VIATINTGIHGKSNKVSICRTTERSAQLPEIAQGVGNFRSAGYRILDETLTGRSGQCCLEPFGGAGKEAAAHCFQHSGEQNGAQCRQR
jgi:hypothetical protein